MNFDKLKVIKKSIFSLSIVLLLTACGKSEVLERMSERMSTKTMDYESCSTASFQDSSINVCKECFYEGSCTIELPGMCAVNIIHFDSNNTIINNYKDIFYSVKIMEDATEEGDYIIIYDTDSNQKLKRCNVGGPKL